MSAIEESEQSKGEESLLQIGENLAPFNPSMQPVVDMGLSLLNLTSDDILYELGCGDGRFMVAAALATPGLRCVGVEYDLKFADRAKVAVKENNVEEQVSVSAICCFWLFSYSNSCIIIIIIPRSGLACQRA
jgi:tRNA G46 methylase TrmB